MTKKNDIFELYRRALLKLLIKNPSITEDFDYLSNSSRYRVYGAMLDGLTDDDVLTEVENWCDEYGHYV